MRSFSFTLHACALAMSLTVVGSTAHAGAPVVVGKRALLSLNVQIDGAGQRASRSDGTDVKWSTHRVLDAKVELVAQRPERQSAADVKGQLASASAYKPSANMEALQKEAAKCKEGDTACQMAVAMKMMETDDAKQLMQQSGAAEQAPVRYQPWQTPPKGGRVDVKAEYLEQWDGVFLTASREVRNCKIALPVAEALSAKDRATLADGLKGLNLEIDTQTGKNSLMLVVGSYVTGAIQCHINDGGRIFDERENKTMTFSPPMVDLQATGGWFEGSAASGATLARGEVSFDSKPDARSLSGMMSVTAPLRVKIRWELTPL